MHCCIIGSEEKNTNELLANYFSQSTDTELTSRELAPI